MAEIELPDAEAGRTETDEEQVLRDLYGEADEFGMYAGQEQA